MSMIVQQKRPKDLQRNADASANESPALRRGLIDRRSELPQTVTSVPARATSAEIVRAQISSGDPVAATGSSSPSFP